MSSPHSESLSANSASVLATDDLLNRLRQFPSRVLPLGILRELQSRGDEIHDSLVALIVRAIDAVRGGAVRDRALGVGVRSESLDVFYAFALLVPIAKIEDRSLIESLLTLPGDDIDELIGELDIEASPYLVANFFKGQNAAELFQWIDQISEHPNLDSFNAVALYRCMTIAVGRGHLDRATAIDALVKCLEKRSDKRFDLQSALVVCELMELQARDLEAVDAVVRASFERHQIDEDYVGLRSWNDKHQSFEVRGSEEKWGDPATALCTWCYEFVSDDLDPVNATFRANELCVQSSRLSAASLPKLIDQLRQSSREQFPRDAVRAIERAFADAYQAIIDLMREELARFQSDSTSWSGNGAYLGLALTVANKMPLPVDLLDKILQMPEDDREQVFGDQFGLIVQAVALTQRYQYDFVEQWIWDTDRSDADRREMVNFYLYACQSHTVDREETISKVVAGLRRAMLEDSLLIGPYAESLALLSTKEHSQLLDEAFERDDTDWLLPLNDLRKLARDSDFAKEQLLEISHSYGNVTKIIEDGVMFDRSLLEVKPRTITRLTSPFQSESLFEEPDGSSPETIRNDARTGTGRNDPCPCGSGKKYKKCCLNK